MLSEEDFRWRYNLRALYIFSARSFSAGQHVWLPDGFRLLVAFILRDDTGVSAGSNKEIKALPLRSKLRFKHFDVGRQIVPNCVESGYKHDVSDRSAVNRPGALNAPAAAFGPARPLRQAEICAASRSETTVQSTRDSSEICRSRGRHQRAEIPCGITIKSSRVIGFRCGLSSQNSPRCCTVTFPSYQKKWVARNRQDGSEGEIRLRQDNSRQVCRRQSLRQICRFDVLTSGRLRHHLVYEIIVEEPESMLCSSAPASCS